MSKKLISDHIVIVSQANGAEKACPCWQIRGWIARGMFDLEVEKGNAVGHDFASHRQGVTEYEAWAKEQKRLVMLRRSAQAQARHVDGGIADAAFHPKAEPAAAAFDDVPPAPEPGTESVGAESKAKPEDVI